MDLMMEAVEELQIYSLNLFVGFIREMVFDRMPRKWRICSKTDLNESSPVQASLEVLAAYPLLVLKRS